MSEFTMPPPPVPGFGPAEPILEQFRLTPFAKMAQAGAQHAAGTVANDLQPALDVANDPRNAWIGTNPVGRGAIEGLAALKAVLGIFAGPKAATANLAKLAEAQALQKAGTRGEDIWHQTGWFQAPDEGWRFEIPDGWANLSPSLPKSGKNVTIEQPFWPFQQQSLTLGDTLNHEALYQAYPQLKDIQVRGLQGGTGLAGGFDPVARQMHLATNTPSKMRDTALHETQHAVQQIEGMAEGGSPASYLPAGFHDMTAEVADRGKRLEAQFAQDIPGFDPHEVQMRLHFGITSSGSQAEDAMFAAFERHPAAAAYQELLDRQRALIRQYHDAIDEYKRLAGETEARLVEHRSNNLGPPMPQSYPPSEYDVPPAMQTIRRTTKGQP